MSTSESGSKNSGGGSGEWSVADVTVEVVIAAPRERVYQAFAEEIGIWWPREFYVSAEAEGLYMETRLGGRLYEDWGGGDGLVWYTVTGLSEGKEIRLSGDLTVEFGGPGLVHTHVLFEEAEEGTRLKFREVIFGRLGPSVGGHEEGWKTMLGNYFKAWVEKGERPSPTGGENTEEGDG